MDWQSTTKFVRLGVCAGVVAALVLSVSNHETSISQVSSNVKGEVEGKGAATYKQVDTLDAKRKMRAEVER